MSVVLSKVSNVFARYLVQLFVFTNNQDFALVFYQFLLVKFGIRLRFITVTVVPNLGAIYNTQGCQNVN